MDEQTMCDLLEIYDAKEDMYRILDMLTDGDHAPGYGDGTDKIMELHQKIIYAANDQNIIEEEYIKTREECLEEMKKIGITEKDVARIRSDTAGSLIELVFAKYRRKLSRVTDIIMRESPLDDKLAFWEILEDKTLENHRKARMLLGVET